MYLAIIIATILLLVFFGYLLKPALSFQNVYRNMVQINESEVDDIDEATEDFNFDERVAYSNIRNMSSDRIIACPSCKNNEFNISGAVRLNGRYLFFNQNYIPHKRKVEL